ncbi:MAG: NUDIX hydrolase [Gammaproteobacteria bacterium]
MTAAFQPHLTVAAVVERDGLFLCVEERANGATVYNQPAGHVDHGESLIDAVRRETLEETGWLFEPNALLGIYRWVQPGTGDTFVRAAFRGVLVEQRHDTPPDADIIAAHWLSRDDLLELPQRSPLVLRCIDDYRVGIRHSLKVLQDLS